MADAAKVCMFPSEMQNSCSFCTAGLLSCIQCQAGQRGCSLQNGRLRDSYRTLFRRHQPHCNKPRPVQQSLRLSRKLTSCLRQLRAAALCNPNSPDHLDRLSVDLRVAKCRPASSNTSRRSKMPKRYKLVCEGIHGIRGQF